MTKTSGTAHAMGAGAAKPRGARSILADRSLPKAQPAYEATVATPENDAPRVLRLDDAGRGAAQRHIAQGAHGRRLVQGNVTAFDEPVRKKRKPWLLGGRASNGGHHAD